MSQPRLLLTEQVRTFCTQDLRSVRDLEAFLHGLLGFSRRDALEIASRFVGKAERSLAAANIHTPAALELALRLAGYSQSEAHAVAARFDVKAQAQPPRNRAAREGSTKRR